MLKDEKNCFYGSEGHPSSSLELLKETWYDPGYARNVELFQGPVTRAMARRREEEHREKEAKEASSERFEALTPKEVKDTPNADGVNVIIMYGMKNYRREYDEQYHEDYNHGAHTLKVYNIGAYGRDDSDGRWRCPRSMNAFYGNGSYGYDPMVERRTWRSFTFLNSLGIYLERKNFIDFNSTFCAIPKGDEYDFKIPNCVYGVLGVEDRRSIEKELGPIL
ncbi:hypothetical protein M9H77_30797 [Catharanthus roseus]|uniref:Uncharacterized protein n=1 Tax=Catharanthus roseus TaxID=4058 RepID=A0ACB9ZZA7_CATRO|nr:hypothetical protein M9H77_30797 [Catharanthus roseus]